VAVVTTADPTIPHISDTASAPRLTSCNRENSGCSAVWHRCAVQVATAGGIVRQHPEGGVDDADPVDGALGVAVHPQVLQPRVPRPSFQDHQRDHPAGHGVRERRGQLRRGQLRRGGPAIHLTSGGHEHPAQPVCGQRRGERPPAPSADVRHHRDAVHPGGTRDTARAGDHLIRAAAAGARWPSRQSADRRPAQSWAPPGTN
jgi:hypothetical protein